MKALEHSPIRACNIDTADAVFVYDYCYMIWWGPLPIASGHSSFLYCYVITSAAAGGGMIGQ